MASESIERYIEPVSGIYLPNSDMMSRKMLISYLEESQAGIDGLPLALTNISTLIAQECFHSLPPASITGYSLSAFQDKIFHDPSRNWI